MPFRIIRGDITEIQADAIVNTANPYPVIGSGVDSGIHTKAGPKLLEARKKVGSIAVGQAMITPAFELEARFVIHAVGPIWVDGKHGEGELKNLISNFKGTQRNLIAQVNRKLSGWGHYHRTEDAFMEFRHIDVVVEGLLLDKMCAKYPRWHRKTVRNKFWIRDAGNPVFALPTDHSVRVDRLAPLPIKQHKPCRLSYNPYLDRDYYTYLKHRRDIQKSNGSYRGIWTRQSGRCAYCGERMLADQEVELVEQNLGQGWNVQNLIYIHKRCGETVFYSSDEDTGEHIDLFSLLQSYLEDTPAGESPYKELQEYFRKAKQPIITMDFYEIERIIGDPGFL